MRIPVCCGSSGIGKTALSARSLGCIVEHYLGLENLTLSQKRFLQCIGERSLVLDIDFSLDLFGGELSLQRAGQSLPFRILDTFGWRFVEFRECFPEPIRFLKQAQNQNWGFTISTLVCIQHVEQAIAEEPTYVVVVLDEVNRISNDWLSIALRDLSNHWVLCLTTVFIPPILAGANPATVSRISLGSWSVLLHLDTEGQ